MLRVALTGGIATGKTHVLERFRERGASCLDADALARGVTAEGTEAARAIAARFGQDILDRAGAVDRAKLAAIVFSDDTARRDLEAIVHPGVYRAIAAGLRAFELLGGSPLAIVDIPLLYETGHAADFDRVIATVCLPAHQMARLIKRGLRDTEARQRLAAQMPAIDKAARADFVVQTDGSFADTDAKVEQIWKELNRRV
jgi:dephospho-CoA kinase